MPEKDNFEELIIEFNKNMNKLVSILKQKKVLPSTFLFSHEGEGGEFLDVCSVSSSPPTEIETGAVN
ncbi:MAG: hypothetical protein KJ566_00850 [Nanoarchaeota archaeon]|nr:hypothetical protein [Nanoarchaeota archaeon]